MCIRDSALTYWSGDPNPIPVLHTLVNVELSAPFSATNLARELLNFPFPTYEEAVNNKRKSSIEGERPKIFIDWGEYYPQPAYEDPPGILYTPHEYKYREYSLILQGIEELRHVVVEISTGTNDTNSCLLYTSPSPRDRQKSRMPSSA